MWMVDLQVASLPSVMSGATINEPTDPTKDEPTVLILWVGIKK
jgi:hypothetical protein